MPPAAGDRRAERSGQPTAIQLPPLSSLKDSPPRKRSGHEAATHRCIGPSGGGDPSPDHAHGRLPVRAFPRESNWMVAISQPSTDSKVARKPNKASRTSAPPTDWGVWPPAASRKGNTPPGVDALTRVDVACRHLGNEVSCYDTEAAEAAAGKRLYSSPGCRLLADQTPAGMARGSP